MDCPDVCIEVFWLQEWKWVMEDSHKRSCWKNSIGVGVPRPCGSDVCLCSKRCWLCLTVVYWLLECNKVPSWNRTCEAITIHFWQWLAIMPWGCRMHQVIPPLYCLMTYNLLFMSMVRGNVSELQPPSSSRWYEYGDPLWNDGDGGKTEERGGRPVPVPLRAPQITHESTQAWTRVSAMRSRRTGLILSL
jgi:hypothetical protein